MREHAARRPMPADQSILWKPLHDSHYVVASLQPADGGRRKVFVRQQVLAQVQALARVQGRRAVGLLVGHLYQCSVTGADYLVIESIAELKAVADEMEMSTVLGNALAERPVEHRTHLLGSNQGQVVGWYRSVASVEAKPSAGTSSIHRTLFNQPWQLALVLSEEGTHVGGAFFLCDTVNARWFYAPFYELLAQTLAPNQPKPTVVHWPQQYLTADAVAPAIRELTAATELATVLPKKVEERSVPLVPTSTEVLADGAPDSTTQQASRERVGSSDLASAEATPRETTPRETTPPEASQLADRPVARSTPDGLADTSRANRERPAARRVGRAGEKLTIVDDMDQRTSAPGGNRRVSDDDDTLLGDDPNRYIDLARAEGFFIAAKFHAGEDSPRAETLWVLNEPYSGMLLAVVASDSEVIDATLHYNLQTDDAGLRKVAFPEHRDSVSKTIYLRETCLDSLRARCRRLRATNALVREWKVTPQIAFLTPGEWESIPTVEARLGRRVDAVNDINSARIAQLPPGVRSQFHIADAAAPGA